MPAQPIIPGERVRRLAARIARRAVPETSEEEPARPRRARPQYADNETGDQGLRSDNCTSTGPRRSLDGPEAPQPADPSD